MGLILLPAGIILLIFLSAAFITLNFAFKYRNKKILYLFRNVKAKLNLEHNESYFYQLDGKANNIPILFKYYENKSKKFRNYFYTIAEHNLSVDCNIEITHETASTKLIKKIGIDDILTYDIDFDSKYKIKAVNPINVNIILSPKVRKIIDRIIKPNGKLVITFQKIYYFDYFNSINRQDIVINYLNNIITLCKELNNNIIVEDIVIDNIRKEISLQAKLNNLAYLISNYKHEEKTQNLLNELLTHKNIIFQIEAALHLKDNNLATKHFLKILESNIPLNQKAIISIINYLRKNVKLEAIPILKKEYLNTTDKKIKLEILKTFNYFNDSSLNSFLCKLLDQSEYANREILIELIKAIGSCGEKNTIEQLYLFKKKATYMNTALSEAITRIQGRLGNIKAGWISQAEFSDKEGALSKSDEAGNGALSPVKE